jgi:hypothetical protein
MISSVVSLTVALPRARFSQLSAWRRRLAAAGLMSTPSSASSNATSVAGNNPNFFRSASGIVTWPFLVNFTVILFASKSYSSKHESASARDSIEIMSHKTTFCINGAIFERSLAIGVRLKTRENPCETSGHHRAISFFGFCRKEASFDPCFPDGPNTLKRSDDTFDNWFGQSKPLRRQIFY